MGGDLNGFWDIWMGLAMPLGQPLSLGFGISNFHAKLYIGEISTKQVAQ